MNQIRHSPFNFQKAWPGIVLLLVLLGVGRVGAQSIGNLSGTVTDSKTKQRIPFATVILAKTMMGAMADAEGKFNILGITLGKYDVVVSSVGYNVTKIPIGVAEGEQTVQILLEQQTTVLDEVVVKASRSEWLRQLRIFKKYFIGETTNASKCEIRNIEDIDFGFYEGKKIFTARCAKPIVVENLALGYRVNYLLEKFRIDFNAGYVLVSGTPWFEPLEPKDPSQFKRWNKERNRAYYGSLNHFMRCLRENNLEKNKFKVYLADTLGQVKDLRFFLTDENEIFLKGKQKPLRLKIVYDGEMEEGGYNITHRYPGPQISYLKYQKRGLVIHENGYYEDPLSYYLEGYLGWSEKIADALPLEYQPVKK